MVRNITLDYQRLYPNNFEKKGQLVFKVFNEKTAACLERYDKKDTARFVSLVTRMWNMLNVKIPEAGRRLNDPDREQFFSDSGSRLDFLLKMGNSFKLLHSSKRGCRVKDLTSETANALHQTIHGIVDDIKILLSLGYVYVLPGKIQSDRLEGEFWIYRESSGGGGGGYFISVEQVVSSFAMQRLKLYNKLGIQQPDGVNIIPCCSQNLELNDEDLDLVSPNLPI